MYDRAEAIDRQFRETAADADRLKGYAGASLDGASIDAAELVDLFDTQLLSRHLDLLARRSKGKTFYSIGSAGHEAMAGVASAARPDDMAFLHYRDAAFCIHRRKAIPGATPLFDMMLSFAAAAEDPVSGGRHKVLGGADIWAPPQTSTIASHLPKAMGTAHSIGISRSLPGVEPDLPADSVVLCSFGDASANHSTAQGAINAAAWAAYQGSPMPVVFICEDNGIGISVRTPKGWTEANFRGRPGLAYMHGDGRDVVATHRAAAAALDLARVRRKPVFLHLTMVRLMGHAGADIEASYADIGEIEAAERQDPLLFTAASLVRAGVLSPADILSRYEAAGARVARVAEQAFLRPKIETCGEAMAPIVPPVSSHRGSPPLPDQAAREALFKSDARVLSAPMAMNRQIGFALADILLQYPNALIFGEDVARKGGVYGVTQGLQTKFGGTRVMDTLLDEQTILGVALGTAHNGFLPIPEIQFLAYLHNAEDQLRGEASTLSFFSNGQFTNPMVVRVAGLGYQKGFGGHFHNDNAIAVLRDLPGVIVACPSNGADAARLLRECVRLAHEERRVVIFLEPIALYTTQDLYEPGDKLWMFDYVPPRR